MGLRSMGWTEMGWTEMDWTDLAEDRDQPWVSMKCWEIVEWVGDWLLLTKSLAPMELVI
jgi:hypothetical protein